jgi:hypothetical protein
VRGRHGNFDDGMDVGSPAGESQPSCSLEIAMVVKMKMMMMQETILCSWPNNFKGGGVVLIFV